MRYRSKPGVTQSAIAARVGLDVSSVNKILARKTGPKFRDETVRMVHKAARQMGYDFGKPSKAALARALREVYPPGSDAGLLSIRLGLPVERVREVLELLIAVER